MSQALDKQPPPPPPPGPAPSNIKTKRSISPTAGDDRSSDIPDMIKSSVSTTSSPEAGTAADHRCVLLLVARSSWEKLVEKIQADPTTCQASFTYDDDEHRSDLLLHEVVKAKAPLSVIETVYQQYPEAMQHEGKNGYLPLHVACMNHVSGDILAFLISEYAQAVQVEAGTDQMLPLHLACKHSVPEDAMMVLLSSFPEAMMIKNASGRLPMDYAKHHKNQETRDALISYLERGRWLLSASSAALHWAHMEHSQMIHELEEKFVSETAQIEKQRKEESAIYKERLAFLQEALQERLVEVHALQKEIETRRVQSKVQDNKEFKLKTALAKMKQLEDTFGTRVCELEEQHATSIKEAQTKYDSETARLNQLLEEVQAEKEQMKEQSMYQVEELQRVQDSMAKIESEKEELSRLVESVRLEYESRAKEAQEKYESETARLNQLLEQAEVEKEQLKEHGTQQVEELQRLQDTMAQIESDKEELSKFVESARFDHESKVKEAQEKYESETVQLNQLLEEVQAERDQLKEQCTQLTDQAPCLEGTMTRIEREKEELSKLVANLQEENASLRAKVSEHTAESQSLQSVVHKRNLDSSISLNAMTEQIKTLYELLSVKNTQLEHATRDVQCLSDRNAELETKLQTREEEFAHADEELQDLREQAEHVNSLMTSIRHLTVTGRMVPPTSVRHSGYRRRDMNTSPGGHPTVATTQQKEIRERAITCGEQLAVVDEDRAVETADRE